MTEERLLTIAETAARLEQSEATVRRRIDAGELPAVRVGGGAQRKRMRVPEAALEEMLEAERDRMRREMFGDAHADEVAAFRSRTAGFVTGYTDEGGPADEAFVAEGEAKHGPEHAQDLRAYLDRRYLFTRVEREMYDDPSIRQRFEELDKEERFEAEARELASRIRRAERLRDRALEILEEDDLDED